MGGMNGFGNQNANMMNMMQQQMIMQNMMNMMQAQSMAGSSDFGSDDGTASMMSGMMPNMSAMNPSGMNPSGMMDNNGTPTPSIIESMMHHAMSPSSWMGGDLDSPSMSAATQTPPPDQFQAGRSMTPSSFGMPIPPSPSPMNQMGGFWPSSPQGNAMMNHMQQQSMHPMNQNMNM